MDLRHGDDAVSGHVPGTYVRLLFEYLQSRGLDAGKELGQLPPQPDNRGLVRYSVRQWRSLLEAAEKTLADPLLGLHLGRTIRLSHFGLMGYVFQSCESLAAVLVRLRQYYRLLHDVNPLQVSMTTDSVTLEWHITNGRPGVLVTETGVVAIVQLLRGLVAELVSPSCVCFAHGASGNAEEYTEFFQSPVQFGQAVTALHFPSGFLHLPLSRPDAALLQTLEQHVDMLMNTLPQDTDLVHDVRRSITRILRMGAPAIERVAEDLCMSARTLRRHLHERRMSYSQILAEVQQQLSEDYLRDPRLTLAEVAHMVGFSEQSAFQRAFKRWTGETPGEFRESPGDGDNGS